MYGKIFDSMYEGTLYGHWEAIVTLQQMLVLCNQDGVLDMTPQAIAARTSIPLKIILKGITILADTDPHSRTPDEDGRRIVLLDDHRPWGWRLVNYEKYQQIKNRTEKLEADRLRIADKRKANKTEHVAECRKVSQTVADVAPVTVTASVSESTSTALSGKPDAPKPNGNGKLHADAVEILGVLNATAGRNYKPVKANLEMIEARLKDGATADEIKAVIGKKCSQWGTDEKMSEYLRPATLFNRTKFAQYQGELGSNGADWRQGML